jgi:hypothetical protein
MPWRADGEVQMHILRAVQIGNVLDWLDPKHCHGSVRGGAWLVPQFLTDGNRWRGVIWNASGDEIDKFDVYLPPGMPAPSNVVQVDAHGRRYSAHLDDHRLSLSRPLYQWEFVVLT